MTPAPLKIAQARSVPEALLPFSPTPHQFSFPLCAYQGIPIHPDHGLDHTLFSSSPHSPEPLVDAEESDELAHRTGDLLLDEGTDSPTWSRASRSSSVSTSAESDYFSYRSDYTHSTTSFDTSPPSSGASTPTESTFGAKAPLMDASPSLGNTLPLPTSTLFGLWSSASPFCPPASDRKLPSSPRQHPYTRPVTPPAAAAAMLRSYSMPAETQKEVEKRIERRSSLHSIITQNAPGCDSNGAGSVPLQTAFGAGWGSALPPRSPMPPAERLPYPYNLARYGPTPPSRLFSRSYSTTDLPTTAVYAPVRSGTGMLSPSLGQRTRRTLGALTPILGATPEMPESPSRRGRPHRGLSF